MDMSGNTVLVTGGGTGIGRGLAEAFHRAGSRVIVAGRRRGPLDDVASANPGMRAELLDVADAAATAAFAERIVREHPALDLLVNNAGVMVREDLAAGPAHVAEAEAMVATNLLGPIRLAAALLPHLLGRPRAAVVNVTSGLAFVPLAATPTYSATKAALHAYTVALRHQLQGTAVEVVELAPPYVQTRLMGEAQASDPLAMPLADFLEEAAALLRATPTPPEVIVERCRPLRFAASGGNEAAMFKALNATH